MQSGTPISLTLSAAQQIKSLLATAPAGTQGVRLTIKSTGCSGHSYAMEFIPPQDNLAQDDRFEAQGAAIFIPKIHSWMLFGMQIDFVQDHLGNAKFTFSNPNEASRCGCGESFTVARNPEKVTV